jgi:hypothetical protein
MRKPNFFIVGAPRCATVSLRITLNMHPDVFVPQVPEPSFFNDDLPTAPSLRVPDLSAYLALFSEAGEARCLGEKTAWYLMSEVAAARIREFQPDARIIVSLRHPIEMMRSLHAQRLKTFDECITDFGEALRAEPARAREERIPPTATRPFALLYRRAARYAEHVKRYFDAFGRANVLVFPFERLVTNPEIEYRRIFAFLQVDPDFVPNLQQNNTVGAQRFLKLKRLLRRSPRLEQAMRRVIPHSLFQSAADTLAPIFTTSRTEIDVRLRTELDAEFHEEATRLSELVGEDFLRWWPFGDEDRRSNEKQNASA